MINYILGILLFYLAGLILTGFSSPCFGADLILESHETDINGHSNASGVKPGDTIFLKAGLKSFLWISRLHGTPAKPIVIINSGGLVEISGFNYGIKFDSCSDIHLTGKGRTDITYGILAHNITGCGVSVEGLSTGIEIEGLEIRDVTLTGMFAKTDPLCSNFSCTREKYMLRNLSVHDNYIHHTGMEGLYIGNVFYLGYTLKCNGNDTTVYPHLLRGVDIYNNRIEHTAWDGIQVSSADSGCRIRHNLIRYDSEAEKDSQMSGILLGGGTRCDCYNNQVDSGKGDGIDVLSLGGQHIFNNLIFLAGESYRPGQNYAPYLKHGIYCGQYLSLPGTTNYIYNNTINSPKSYGIMVSNWISTYEVCNNIIVDPGLYAQSGNLAYVRKADQAVSVNVCPSNFFMPYYGDVGFVDPAHHNFDLTRFSGAVNAAGAIPGVQLDFDILYRLRPFATKNDIGAYECQDSALLAIPENVNPAPLMMTILGNPAKNALAVQLSLNRELIVQLTLFDVSGNPVTKLPEEKLEPGTFTRIIPIANGISGIYILECKTQLSSETRKIILLP